MNYSFVEVLMIKYEPGDTEYQDYLENELDCFDKPWEDCTREIVNEQIKTTGTLKKLTHSKIFNTKPDCEVTDSFYGFSFRIIGQDFSREYSGGLDWEMQSLTPQEVFGDYSNELKEMGHSIIEDKKAQGLDFTKILPDKGKVIRFVTLWNYTSYQDSYYGDWDSEWELLGLVDLGKVTLMLKGEK